MTKSHSRFRSAFKMMLPAPLIIMLALVFGCESTSSDVADISPPQDEITIQITASDVIKLNGKEFQTEELESHLSNLPEPPEVVHLDVSNDATVGIINDVQQVLRKNEAFRIRYKSTRPDSDSLTDADPDQLTKDFLDSLGAYLELPPLDVQKRIDAYESLVQNYDSLKTRLQQIPDAPPPPPLPPSPQKNIARELDEVDSLHPPIPPPPVKSRNLIQININSDGNISINIRSIALNEMRSILSDFIENPTNDSNMAESPEDAIISIKTVQDTPYAIYIETLDEVMFMYNQLREKASLEQFGVPYSALSNGGAQKQTIDSAYPKRISIAKPNN